MKPRSGSLLLFCVTCAASGSPVFAQVPAGEEFQINTYIAWDQTATSVASDPSGAFVVVWTSDTQDGSGLGVFARRYDPAGVPEGAEFQVNAYTTGAQFAPAIAADAAGNFIVAWTSAGQDGSGTGVFARRFARSGVPQGPEFLVNSYTTGDQREAALAIDGGRNVAVAWSGAGDGAATGIFARRYGASGAPSGTVFLVHADTSNAPREPAIAFDGDGRFVVVWQTTFWGVFARRYDESGTPMGPAFRVDTPDPFNFAFNSPRVAADAAGHFVVAWSRRDYWPPIAPHAGRGPGESGVFGQMYDPAGTPRGGQFTVVSSLLSSHTVSLAADAGGQFVIAWDHKADGEGLGVFARRYDAAGVPRGSEFRVNSYLPLTQSGLSVASDGSGNLAAAWTSEAQDGDRKGVFGQRFGGILPAALAADTFPLGSDGNGVFEPGESIDVRPSWMNANGAAQTFDGAGVGFSGPPATGVSYRLTDPSGAYGAVGDGATAQCADCYRVEVTYGGARPAVHWDATFTERLTPDVLGQAKLWPLHVGQSFADVPKTSLYYKDIETLLHRGVTAGCSANAYCPVNPVTREQMAAFVLLAKEGKGYIAPPCSPPNLFADVPESSLFCDVIEELARRSVVSGCGGGNYCPGGVVTREQMPVFVLRLLDPTLEPPVCTAPMFADVPASSPYCRWIEELARRGVVGGCGGGNYCPTSPVTREQMAVFLAGTYGLRPYGPRDRAMSAP